MASSLNSVTRALRVPRVDSLGMALTFQSASWRFICSMILASETMRTIIMEEIDYDFTNLSVATLKWGGECNVLTQELMGLITK